MNYNLIQNNNDISIQVEKEYDLIIRKNNADITICKRKNNSCYCDINNANYSYSLNGQISAVDVNHSLANIRHIGFEITDSCNLDCVYCIYGKFYHNHDVRSNKKIDPKKAKLLIDYLVDKLDSSANISPKNEVFISFYGGEPLLNMKFIKDIVDYTQKIQNSHVLFKYMITTNAIYLKKHLDFIIKYSFIVTVSLDGSEKNDAYRNFQNGNPSFKIVYDTLKYIQKYHYDYFDSCLQINSVIHNLNNQQEIFSFIYHEFGKIPNFSMLNYTGVRSSMINDFNIMAHPKLEKMDNNINEEMNKILDLESNDIKKLQSFVFHYSGNVYENYNDLLINKGGVEHLPTSTCLPFSRRIFMTVNNKILPCERIGHEFALGEIENSRVNIDLENIAFKYNNYYNSIKSLCANCFYKMHCLMCMFDISNIGENPICERMADKQKFKEYLNDSMRILAKRSELYKRIMNEIILV
ncbi:radical SAM peptide maturase [Bacteroides sp.]|uniref:radical SAM peptide maturase n=1 Tax=Bacteroides sp. TaxID=29523 RepID=UPI00260606ED|nr:radical SAM peptide maturase [Bacteroides sp.]MDD3040937.1 radical SAM peptide maturase [Bacteroides sp.]